MYLIPPLFIITLHDPIDKSDDFWLQSLLSYIFFFKCCSLNNVLLKLCARSLNNYHIQIEVMLGSHPQGINPFQNIFTNTTNVDSSCSLTVRLFHH